MNCWHNPVVRGTAPDPSIARVDRDCYLADSTMDFWPGITIRHSSDLINWRLIGPAVSRPAQYRRDGRPDLESTVVVGSGSAQLLSAEAVEDFVGVRFALVAFRPGGTDSAAQFDRISRPRADPLVAGGRL